MGLMATKIGLSDVLRRLRFSENVLRRAAQGALSEAAEEMRRNIALDLLSRDALASRESRGNEAALAAAIAVSIDGAAAVVGVRTNGVWPELADIAKRLEFGEAGAEAFLAPRAAEMSEAVARGMVQHCIKVWVDQTAGRETVA